jgi:uncharacterized protein YbaR (Trm112 family)
MAVQLDAELLEILACPSPDHAPLRIGTPTDPRADYLHCTECSRCFPVRDGIPVLLLGEAVSSEQVDRTEARSTAPASDEPTSG